MKKLLALALALALLGTAPAALAQAAPTGTVMLYTSTGEDVVLALKAAFEAKYPGVTLDYYAATSGNCVTKLATEFQSGTVACDVAWLADFSSMITLKSNNQLEKIDSPMAAAVDNQFKDPEGYYCGARMLLMGITYSTLTCSDAEAPTNWDGVLNETFKNQILLTDPTGSASTKALVYALINNERYGWEYFEKLKELGAELESSSGATNNKVASGSYKIAFGVDYNTKNMADQGSPLGFHDTDDVVAVACPIGIPVGAPHMELAKLFYEFLLDPQGGQLVLTQYNVTPVAPGVTLPEGIKDAAWIAEHALPIDFAELSAISTELLDKFDGIFKK